VAGGKRTAAGLGAWLIFEDESGQGLRPPRGRTWGRRGATPVVMVTGAHSTRVSLAALIAVKPGLRPRRRRGFTEAGYAQLLDAAHQQPGGPLVVVGQPEYPRQPGNGRADRGPDWLTIFRLPPCAHELDPVELVWSHLRRSLASLARRTSPS
jgi:hypothetical protein